ncbi:MAG: NADH-quinone oxidoreductase subunit NuoG [Betaproteobacteria bacterium]|nr:NADH-quinone oxidoreductase subunit NuoG [Betaproteobacteria bacterium]
MATLYVDGQAFSVDPTQNLLHECLSLGLDLPYFCWHPALGSVGACRQCAVKLFRDEGDHQGVIVMACMTPADDGTRISLVDEQARDFRARVIEWMMAHHPHDCPVCDEGGECHLQDMTVMTGHVHRRYRFPKRTFDNQHLGPFVNHEMNRCIQCYRCVRFYNDYAGGTDFGVFGSRDHVYFGRAADGVLENEFSGNLVEVCPTGVFTDKTLKAHYTRKWDLQSAPSVCPHCGLGCHTTVAEHDGVLRRVQNRFSADINGYFLCDRGRYGYAFVNAPERLRRTSLRNAAGRLNLAPADALLQELCTRLGGNMPLIGIASPRASLEANFALRTLVKPENFFLGWSAVEDACARTMLAVARGIAPLASLAEVESSDAILVLGEDITQTAPRMALAARQAVRHAAFAKAKALGIPVWQDLAVRQAAAGLKSPLFIASVDATRLDDAATECWRGAPDDMARLGFAIGRRLSREEAGGETFPSAMEGFSQRVARALAGAARPLVVTGSSLGCPALLDAAAHLVGALRTLGLPAKLALGMPERNTMGLALMGGESLHTLEQATQKLPACALIVLENDLSRRIGEAAADRVFAQAGLTVLIDHKRHAGVERADYVLPAATFAEESGTTVNHEGRAQRFFQVFSPPDDIQASWRWLRDIGRGLGREPCDRWTALDDVLHTLEETLPVFHGLAQAAPEATYRRHGLKLARKPHRASGRTAVHAHLDIHEHQPPTDCDSPLTFSMEGHQGSPPGPAIPVFWAPGWNSVQALSHFQREVGGTLCGEGPGLLLIAPAQQVPEFFQEIPPAFVPRDDALYFVPAWHIFGSEEQSAGSPAVRERIPAPYVALRPEDAARAGLAAGDTAALEVGAVRLRLPWIAHPELPQGVGSLPVGLPAMPWLMLPAWGAVAKASR